MIECKNAREWAAKVGQGMRSRFRILASTVCIVVGLGVTTYAVGVGVMLDATCQYCRRTPDCAYPDSCLQAEIASAIAIICPLALGFALWYLNRNAKARTQD